jgi:PD-(D/E)XK nuclease superfamily
VLFVTTALNPAQRRVFELLRRSTASTPAPEGLAAALHADLEDALSAWVSHLGGERFFVNKHDLNRIHGCERHFLGTHTDFEWTARTARGSVVHKAVQLTINWRGEPHPPQLVDEALAILVAGDDGLARWLGGVGEAVRAELRSEAVDLVSAFQECFPPLKAAWRPVTETAVRIDVFGGLVRLTGRVDLTLGTPSGDRPGKVIVDLKTGVPAAHHRDDLRFYALVETARMGVPPRQLATYYLDAARVEVEGVTPAVLDAALARTVDGTRKLIEVLRAQRAAVVSPGPLCGWCPLRPDCSEGTAHWDEQLAWR